MCGIVGAAGSAARYDGDLLAFMRDRLTHRGPDDAGLWISPDGRVSLGHRRLTIIDLSPAGHQPMSDPDGQCWLAFNGEIYNHRALRQELEHRGHRFRSACDTEVIIGAYRAWGLSCVDHLNGMFAFALYDVTAGRVLLARDRAGEKPLFYHRDGDRLVFASELKALFADPSVPRDIDPVGLDHYLALGYVPGDLCLVQGVRKLPPATALTYDVRSGAISTWRYWDLPEHQPDGSDVEDLTEQLGRLLEESIRLRLVADVPVGILLSGGIDSSLVTAAAAAVSSRPVRTFTVSFPGYGVYDESPHARIVARHFGTDHTELAAESTSVELLPELARQYDEPMADSSMIPTFLVSRMIRRDAKVALGGDGGDELFGGYNHYRWLLRRERLRGLVPGPLRTLAGVHLAGRLPVGFKGRNYLTALPGGSGHAIAHVNLYFDEITRRRLAPATRGTVPGGDTPEAYRRELVEGSGTIAERAMEVDFRTYLPDDILVKVDRASMLTSLEVRAPWLDHRIIEFAFARVPGPLRAHGAELKILPRRLAAQMLPPQLNLDRKQGFSLPLASWFKGRWGDYVADVLHDAPIELLDAAAVDSLLAGQRRGLSNTQRLYALTMLELWRRQYAIAI